MIYEFVAEDLDELRSIISERDDVLTHGFDLREIDRNEDEIVSVYGYRITIPELNISVREGMLSETATEDFICDCFAIYDLAEKDCSNYRHVYSNTSFPYLLYMLNPSGKKGIKCYIDDVDFEFMF